MATICICTSTGMSYAYRQWHEAVNVRSIPACLVGHFNGIEFASWATSIRVQYASKLVYVHGLITYSEQNSSDKVISGIFLCSHYCLNNTNITVQDATLVD